VEEKSKNECVLVVVRISMGSPLALECSSVEAKNTLSDAYS